MRNIIPFLLFISSMILWADNDNWTIDERAQGMGFSIDSKGDFLLMSPSLNIDTDGNTVLVMIHWGVCNVDGDLPLTLRFDNEPAEVQSWYYANDGGVMISAYMGDNLELVRRLKNADKLAIRTYYDNDANTILDLEFDLSGFKTAADQFMDELWWW